MASISSWVLDFTTPIIIRSSVDSAAATIVANLLDTYGNLAVDALQDPPGTADYSSLDNLLVSLGNRDVVVLGGPIANPIALGMQANWGPGGTLAAMLTSVGLTELSFSTNVGPALDGAAFDDAAPSLFAATSALPGGVTYQRTQQSSQLGDPIVADFGIIIRFDGTVNKLLYVAGVRDFSTAAASFFLDAVSRYVTAQDWIDVYGGDGSEFISLKSVLDNPSNTAVVLPFEIPNDPNGVDINVVSVDTFAQYAENTGLPQLS